LGAPRRNRKKFSKPKIRWDIERINADNAMLKEYGLKNMKELWKVQTEVSRVRRNVRSLLSEASPENAAIQQRLLGRLTRYKVVQHGATLDNILDVNEDAFLSRRLQTIVFKRGMARSIKQARQLITHGFISIGGKRVNKPGYAVSDAEESMIGFYKPIDVNPKQPTDRAPIETAAPQTTKPPVPKEEKKAE
jgi:small subunit ribosomal protein S4